VTVDASIDFVDTIRRESDAFALAADHGDLEARVPSCPEWTLGDLVWHLTDVQWFWNQIASGPLLSRDDIEDRPEPPPNDDHLVAGFREGVAQLVQTLDQAEPGTRVWSWADGEQDIAWVRRRMAHEMAIHRWDGESTIGDPRSIDASLALDGIDEWAEWMVDPEDLALASPAVVRLLATDREVSRTFAVQSDGTFAAPSIAADLDPDGTIEAPAADLDLLLWRRVTPDDVTITGDRAVVQRLLDAADLS
jgi:uncharacterized protein (TIGR03083 family)